MKEIELDKYVGKYVEVELDYTKIIRQGILHKITNGWWKRNGVDCQAIINKGYILECFDRFLNLRQSHIKKIREICKGECL